MNIVPIVFAFDDNLVMPASVCISSLLMNAKEDTFYDIYILHAHGQLTDRTALNALSGIFSNYKLTFRTVDNTFNSSFQIRGINCTTYYRLLIPEIIQEYDKIIYSDVDVIFRNDLSNIYNETVLDLELLAGVNAMNNLYSHMTKYYRELNVDPSKTIYAGNIILNSKLLRESGMVNKFKSMAHEKFRFQDMDIINICCQGKIKFLSPEFCVTNYINEKAVNDRESLFEYWNEHEIEKSMTYGIIHYNGQKPWKGWCPNFDIWWEYYRKSPVFDEKFYFDFYYSRLNELDQLPLMKRIKILIRYFVYGKRKNP